MEVTDEEVQAPIEAELRRNGNLTDVERPVATGDFVTLDLAATREGEPVPGLNADEWQYEVGKGWIADDFDDRLVGTEAGVTLEFATIPSGTEDAADFVVTVDKIQTLELPELTDEWVSENVGEFDTVDAWRDSIRTRMADIKLGQARQQLVERTSGALAELIDTEVPEALIENELRGRAENFVMQLQAQGIELEQYLAATGQDQGALVEGLREASTRAVKVDLGLRAVADAEEIEADDDDVDREYERIALRANQKPNQVRKAYERGDAVPELKIEIRKGKALEWLLRHVEIVDPEARPSTGPCCSPKIRRRRRIREVRR